MLKFVNKEIMQVLWEPLDNLTYAQLVELTKMNGNINFMDVVQKQKKNHILILNF